MGNYRREGYHDRHPSWRSNFDRRGNYIGIELEVDSSDYLEVLRLLPDFPAGTRPLTERDGSLGADGVEIIFPPIPLARFKRRDNQLHVALAAIKDVVEHNSRTGMHMNVNSRYWTDDQRGLFCAIINNMTPEHLKNLGGRYPTEYCLRVSGAPFVEYLPFVGYLLGGGRHRCADNHGTRIEVRFPVSTCDPRKLDVLADFISRLTAFCRFRTEEAMALVPRRGSRGSYAKLVAKFYEFLDTTKNGKKVLEEIHTDRPAASAPSDWDDDDYDREDYYDGDNLS